jgi:hypothetical protein
MHPAWDFLFSKCDRIVMDKLRDLEICNFAILWQMKLLIR